MKTLSIKSPRLSVGTFCSIVLVLSLLGLVRDARAAGSTACQNGPMVKNLAAMTYRAPADCAAEPQQLTMKAIKKLSATAESSEDRT